MDFPSFSLDTTFLETTKEPEPDRIYDLLILGGGPAAMSAAVYAARKMIAFALISKDLGGQIRETSEIENWLGFQNVNAKDLADSFTEHVKSFSIPVAIGASISTVNKQDDEFRVFTDTGKHYRSKTIILATGKRHRSLNVPGEEGLVGKGVAYCATCDAPFYAGKKVVVAGGGNSAFTTAMDLIKVDAEVTLVNFIRGWQADEALQERITKAGKAILLDYHQVSKIEGTERVTGVIVTDRQSQQEKRIEASGIFIEVGLLPNSDMVKGLVDLNDQGEVIVDCLCQTSVDGFYGAGDVTTVPHKQIIIAAGEGAKAALSAYSYLMDKSLI
jgi:NADH-dependent peroxiredoxin subunit F